MDRNIGLMPRDVGGAYRAMQVDWDVRIALLRLGHCDPDFAGERPCTQKIERGGCHSPDGRDHLRAFVGQACAVHVAREKHLTGLPFEIADASAHGIDGKAEPLRRRAKAAAADDFQEDARRVPICETGGHRLAFLRRNAPFHCEMHTIPSSVLNLAEYWAHYNHGGFFLAHFDAYPYC
jgi:hypothetical protein